MPIMPDAHRDTLSSALDTRTECPDGLVEDGSRRSRLNASRNKIAAAISWLAKHLIESFAAYGEALYPCYFDADEFINGQESERDSQRHGSAGLELQDEAPWLSIDASAKAENPCVAAHGQTVPRGWMAKATSSVVGFWARLRAKRRMRLTIKKMATLADHMLNDIDVHRCGTEGFEEDSDRYRW